MNGIENKQPLLSICIPTYNRGGLLSYSLLAILEACIGFENKIEVIVSDNCSSDNTKNIIEAFLPKYPYLTYYRNNENIGANANFYKLTDSYASGKYCWLLGDDDVVHKDTFPYILNILENNDIDFLKLNFDIKKIEDIKKTTSSYINNSDYYIKGNYGQITDTDACSENILNTFISSSIFKLVSFKQYKKPTIYLINNWQSFKEVFSHACIHATIFGKSTKCMFFSYPALSVCQHEKDWDDKIDAICTLFLPQLYYFSRSKGVDKKTLKNTKATIVRDCLVFLLKGKNHKNFKWPIIFLLRNVITTIKSVGLLLKQKFR